MTATLNRIEVFKWKAVLTFFGTLGMSMGGALTTSSGTTTWQNWVVALLFATGAASAATVALFVQLEKTIPADSETPSP
jgi:hypothetical protein